MQKILVTTRCNLNCIYCLKDKKQENLSLADIIGQIDKASEAVLFKGGEPLLRKDIIEIET